VFLHIKKASVLQGTKAFTSAVPP